MKIFRMSDIERCFNIKRIEVGGVSAFINADILDSWWHEVGDNLLIVSMITKDDGHVTRIEKFTEPSQFRTFSIRKSKAFITNSVTWVYDDFLVFPNLKMNKEFAKWLYSVSPDAHLEASANRVSEAHIKKAMSMKEINAFLEDIDSIDCIQDIGFEAYGAISTSQIPDESYDNILSKLDLMQRLLCTGSISYKGSMTDQLYDFDIQTLSSYDASASVFFIDSNGTVVDIEITDIGDLYLLQLELDRVNEHALEMRFYVDLTLV